MMERALANFKHTRTLGTKDLSFWWALASRRLDTHEIRELFRINFRFFT